MRGERSFYNGRTGREEAWLWRDSAADEWVVESLDRDEARYSGCAKGHAAALTDYNARVARLQKEAP